jgi:hypothetical protein
LEGADVIIKIDIVLSTPLTLRCLQQFPAFTELEEEDLTRSKGTNNNKWRTYEALLTDVLFEWPEPFADETKEESEKACRAYLDTFTNGYTMCKFYLKKEPQK